MDPKRLQHLKRRATAAIETARGDGFAEVVLELVARLEQLAPAESGPHELVEEPEPKPKGRARGYVPQSD
ncbi:MAG: hypothetical protein ACR2RE_29355 [Geminicoccaceae bacterium]